MAFISFCSLCTSSLLLLLLLLFFSPLATTDAAKSMISSYIVHTSSHVRPSQFSTQDEWYTFMINTLTNHQTNLVKHARIFYTYSVVFQGFAAVFTAQEAEKMAEMPGVTGVFEDEVIMELHTTRTPDFLGLNVDYGLWPDTDFGDNVIIGLVDSGIWPESNSFNDDGLGPIPKGWKGACEEGTQLNSTYCNKKLIGARLFFQGIENLLGPVEDFGDNRSPRDGFGHGTHTASIAAGTEVAHANLFGFAGGNARGVATKARIAMYKACFRVGCTSSDILAAMESAIEDGVNVLSLSLGAPQENPYYSNVIAIGAFAAVKRNIFVTCSAGNSGPQPFSVVNAAPWITTVGAGSIDRTFPVQVQLGNGKVFVGSSLYMEKINTSTTFPLVYLNSCTSININPYNVMGKIVVCDWAGGDGAVNNGFLVEAAGGVGLIEVNGKDNGEGLQTSAFTLPSATVGYREGLELLSYINTTKNPTASFMSEDLTVVGKDRAPIVISFSSRGPNSIVPELLKPDIIAPGFNIIAAWPTDAPPSLSANDPRSVQFNIISGTSMACPHVAGVAALLYAAHPDWSPAAIRSALLTSSAIFDYNKRPIARYEDLDQATSLGLGAGHINPQLAADPGLVYDADISDYINFLCSLNYTQEQLKIIVNETDSCSGSTSSPGDLNYPSFSVVFKLNNSVHTLKRTVTQVGELPETYTVKIINPRPEKVAIRVDPQTLTFDKMYEKQSYTVEFMSTFVAGYSSNIHEIVGNMEFGYIIWESDKHIIRSPVALMWNSNLY